jgi:hypothetical protein
VDRLRKEAAAYAADPRGYEAAVLRTEPAKDVPPEARIEDAYEVVSKDIVFDNSDWRPIESAHLVYTRPIEPAYCTTVLRLKRRPGATARAIAIERDSEGYAVIPVLLRPGDRVLTRPKPRREMPEARTDLFSSYQVVDVVGDEVEVVRHSVYWNGTQGQQPWAGPGAGGEPPSDWWATRVPRQIAAASLAVILPAGRKLGPVRARVRRAYPDERFIDLGVPPDSLVRHQFVLPVPVERDAGHPRIFSIAWTWA